MTDRSHSVMTQGRSPAHVLSAERMRSRALPLLLVSTFVGGIAAAGPTQVGMADQPSPSPTAAAAATGATTAVPTPTPVVVTADGRLFIMPRDEGDLARSATDVFLGRVAGQALGTPVVEPRVFYPSTSDLVPATLYTVDVIETIKGTAAGRVVALQSGIFDDAHQDLGDGAALLAPGEVAVFVAIRDPATGRYLLLDGRFGHTRVGDDQARAQVLARYRSYLATPAAATPSPPVLAATPPP